MKYPKVHIATYQKEKVGNSHCGDRYFFTEVDQEFICIIADGLGSGEIAGESSQAVIEVIKENAKLSDEIFVKRCAKRLVGKRGVVLGVLRIDFQAQKYKYSSIGNIALVITTNNNDRKRTIPRPGFLGSYERELKVIQGRLEDDMGFLMFSDGVTDQELSQTCFWDKDVEEVIQAFSHICGDVREDDTTLIAMRYSEDHF